MNVIAMLAAPCPGDASRQRGPPRYRRRSGCCRRPASARSPRRACRGRHRREIAPQAPGAAAVAPAHFQHVAEATRGDDADLRPAPFQQRVGANGGAVDDGIDRRSAPPSASRPLRKPCASSPRRDGTFAVRNRPAAESSRNRSVKVPPTSTPTMTPRLLMVSRAPSRWRRRRVYRRRAAPPCSREARSRARCSRAARRPRPARARALPDRRSRRRPAFPAAPSGRGES